MVKVKVMFDFDKIIAKLDLTKGVLDPVNLLVLSPLPKEIREEIAYHLKMMVLYVGNEVQELKLIEEEAVLKALPPGSDPIDLNVINVGAGNRLIHSSFLSVDAFREPMLNFSGVHHENSSHAILAVLDDLPFKENSLDAIISLHSLEHIRDPVSTITSWLSMLKSGGAIGLILPDYRYTYSARNDRSIFGHKWDPTPELMQEWHKKYWSDLSIIESLNTYSWKLSFDLILRKPGNHQKFKDNLHNNLPISGFELSSNHQFPNDIY